MTEQELTDIEDALRAEHHSEVRWAHEAARKLLAEVRYLREHLDNAEGDRDRGLERIGKLEAAITKVIKHQPWPSTDQADRDFAEAGMLVPVEF